MRATDLDDHLAVLGGGPFSGAILTAEIDGETSITSSPIGGDPSRAESRSFVFAIARDEDAAPACGEGAGEGRRGGRLAHAPLAGHEEKALLLQVGDRARHTRQAVVLGEGFEAKHVVETPDERVSRSVGNSREPASAQRLWTPAHRRGLFRETACDAASLLVHARGSMRVTDDGVKRASQRLEAPLSVEMLGEAHRVFGRRAAILSSMQKAGSVLCHMAERAGLSVRRRLRRHRRPSRARRSPPATRSRKSHRHLSIVTLAPERSLADQIRDEGLLYLTKEGQERCCDLRKSAPLRAIRGRYDAFIGGLRRDEGGLRGAVRAVALDPEMNALRIHPLVAATGEDLDRYLPRNTPTPRRTPSTTWGFSFDRLLHLHHPGPRRTSRRARRALAPPRRRGLLWDQPDRPGLDAAPVELDDRYAPFFA